ncbi:glycosyltransferase family 4 protein [Qipengyuania citrea]|uniref:glycosyltransferase family 4 protein n=1 Tax=Qipengyuania citrea TaxID=225971 RepID=UPI001E623915|nr:glycosyltransferase family 4 protein [Qipengyuania citrea]MCD1590096.1 glycosyltransferase family 4 protein [Qipengyuania citrea]MCZ4264881.1 glycosyltransferase family 4 protein [Erythrobacter sp. G21629-S1]
MKHAEPSGDIVYLTQLYTPEPTFKGDRFAKGLDEAGYDVEVVTGFPNYPGGRVYDGFKMRPIARGADEGLKVVRLATYPSHDRSAVRRILSYLSFSITSFLYLLFRRRPRLIYVYYPSLTAGLTAIAIKWLRRVPVVVDIQDMWPDSLGAAGMMQNGRLIAMVEWFCQLLYRNVDHIVVLSPGFRHTLIERGVPAEKITVIYNWADEMAQLDSKSVTLSTASPFDPKHTFTLLFAGNMGAAQRLDSVLDAAKSLAAERGDIGIYLMGGGVDVERLKARVADEEIGNVRFLPRVPLPEVQDILRQAGALLVHLARDPLFAITVPSKTQSYLYAGRPILMAVDGNAADLVAEGEAGIVVEPENPQALADAIRTLADMGVEGRDEMGARSRAFYDRKLTFRQGMDATIGIIERFRRRSRDEIRSSI